MLPPMHSATAFSESIKVIYGFPHFLSSILIDLFFVPLWGNFDPLDYGEGGSMRSSSRRPKSTDLFICSQLLHCQKWVNTGALLSNVVEIVTFLNCWHLKGQQHHFQVQKWQGQASLGNFCHFSHWIGKSHICLDEEQSILDSWKRKWEMQWENRNTKVVILGLFSLQDEDEDEKRSHWLAALKEMERLMILALLSSYKTALLLASPSLTTTSSQAQALPK